MARCPHCDDRVTDVDDLGQTVFRSGGGGTTAWSCPSCDAILGVSDW